MPSGSVVPAPNISRNSAQAVATWGGHDGRVRSWWLHRARSGFGGTDNKTRAKGYWEQCAHQAAVLTDGRLQPGLEGTNSCSQYENMTASQLSDSVTSGQTRACWALLHGDGLDARISCWVGMLLKAVPRGWEIPCHSGFSVVTNSLLSFEILAKWCQGMIVHL